MLILFYLEEASHYYLIIAYHPVSSISAISTTRTSSISI